MPRHVSRAVVAVAGLGLLLGANPVLIGEEKAKLPSYLVDIVTESQKQQIRTIQEKYAKQIADLQAQIDAATKQCDTEIESLLNADQKAKTKKAREELAARAKKAAEEKKGPTKSKATTFSGYANSLLDRQ